MHARACVSAVVLLLLFAGCGGSDQPATGEPTRAKTTTDPQLPAEAIVTLDNLGASLDRLELLAASSDCGKVQQVRRERARMRRLAGQLARYEDHQAAGDDIASIGEAVHKTDVSVEETLAACRDQRELEQAADEARRLADEIDQYGD